MSGHEDLGASATPPPECPRCGYGSMTAGEAGHRCPECGSLVPGGSLVLRAESLREASWFPRRGVMWLAIGGVGFMVLIVLVLVIVMRVQGGGGGFVVPWYAWLAYLVPCALFVMPPAMSGGRPRWLIVVPNDSVTMWRRRGRRFRVTPRRVRWWSVSRPEQGAVYVVFRVGWTRRMLHGRFRLDDVSRDDVVAALERTLGRPPVAYDPLAVRQYGDSSP